MHGESIKCLEKNDGHIFYQAGGEVDLYINPKDIMQFWVNVDFWETGQGLNTFDEVLEQFKGRCILNLYRCFGFLEEVVQKVERHGMREQIFLKNAPNDEALKKVEELVFASEDAPIAQDSYIDDMHRKGKILWGNPPMGSYG